MLMYGESISPFMDNLIVYNLASFKEGFNKLNLLVPPNNIGRFTDREFDIAYMNYIMNNDNVFCEFFQIIYNLYIGKDVFILTSFADWTENILESLLKLIQQRYGYNAVQITSDEDYIDAKNNLEFKFAPGYGLYNLDQDKERFTYIIESYRLTNNKVLFNLPWIVE